MRERGQGYPNPTEARGFWRDALAWNESITRRVSGRVLFFGAFGAVVALGSQAMGWRGLEDTHLQYTGGALVLLLVLRTNAGYERWWEARKLWGGIVNQSRNLVIKALAYGPPDPEWRERLVRWAAAFPHVTRRSLRGERDAPELEEVLGSEAATREVTEAEHMPSLVATKLSELLAEARRSEVLEGWALLEIERERALLIDHLGGCERILKTPLPRVHTIKLRRFILLYLLWLPIAIGSQSWLLSGVVAMLVAYPLFAIDQIGQELENPFSQVRASHLPLDGICETIQKNLFALLAQDREGAAELGGRGAAWPGPRG